MNDLRGKLKIYSFIFCIRGILVYMVIGWNGEDGVVVGVGEIDGMAWHASVLFKVNLCMHLRFENIPTICLNY